MPALLFVAWLAACQRSTCDYQANACADGSACAFTGPGEPRCMKMATLAAALPIPVAVGREVWCTEGGRSAAGTAHSFVGDLFAVDIASTAIDNRVEVVAPVDGVLYVFDECKTRDGAPTARSASRCGMGYGNHVKIWDGENVVLLAHLSVVVAFPGPIKKGQIIGFMGASGAASHRHVHLSVTRPSPEMDPMPILTTPGWKGQLPVRFALALPRRANGAPVAWVDALACSPEPAKAPHYVVEP